MSWVGTQPTLGSRALILFKSAGLISLLLGKQGSTTLQLASYDIILRFCLQVDENHTDKYLLCFADLLKYSATIIYYGMHVLLY